MATCAKCGATASEGATFCGSCGASLGAAPAGPSSAPGTSVAGTPPAAAAGTEMGMSENVAGALAYFTIIPAIIFIVAAPYNKNRVVRFHAFQSLFFGLGIFALCIVMIIVGLVLAVIPVLGWILDILLWIAIWGGGFVLWAIMTYKAYNNSKFVLPLIGKLAEEQAAKPA